MYKFALLLMLLILSLGSVSLAADAEMVQALELLTSSSFDEKTKAIVEISKTADGNVEKIFKAILESDLYYIKKNKRIVLAQKEDSKYRLFDVLSGEDLGLFGKRKVKKVSINNMLRKQLKFEISRLKLLHADADVRLASVESLMGLADTDMVAQLESIKAGEKDAEVLSAINAVIALTKLDSTVIETRLDAIAALDGNLNPAVLNRLKKLSDQGATRALRQAAANAVASIEARATLLGYLETLFFGLSLGSILALAAIGLAITFGVMGVINMAHGELIMIGAYTTYVIQLIMPNNIGLSIIVAIPAAFVVSGLVGIAIERFVIRLLHGRPLETLLATFGVSLFLQQSVRSIFSPLNRPVESPEWMSGSLHINSLLSITYNRLYIFLFCLIIFVLLYLIMSKTSLGLHVRAISQNRPMARAMGIKSQRVDAMTFGLGSGIAGVAGVALSQITNVGPNLGQAYIVDSFMVVVFGGVGNLWGTLISGLTLGVVGKYLEPVTGAVLAKIVVLVFIILFIQKRPRGMFPQKGRAAEQ